MKKSSNILIPCLMLGLSAITSCGNKKQQVEETPVQKEAQAEIVTFPSANPFLAAGDYSSVHFGPAQTNTFSHSVKEHSYQVYSKQLQDILPVLMPSMILNATADECYWVTDMGQAYYMTTKGDRWAKLAAISLDGKAADTLRAVSIKAFADSFYTTGAEMDKAVASLFGKDAKNSVENGRFPVVDKDNVLYTFFNRKLVGITLADAQDPAKGLVIKSQLDLSKAIPANDRIVGMQMTYDGYLVVNSAKGVFCIIDRANLSIKNQMQVTPTQLFFAPVAVDDKNGIYAVSDSMMMKLVWNGTNLSVDEKEGAWSCPIKYDRDPELMKQGGGVLGAPVLMGFGNDPDKLVVITDGASRTNLMAFWRDSIPADAKMAAGASSKRVAGMINVTCGFNAQNMASYIQSYHSVPVMGYGAFVANTINGYPVPTTPNDFALLGSILPTAKGVERFQWDYTKNEWISVWSAPTVGCSAMNPVISKQAKLILLNSFDSSNAVEGWSVKGYDWATGAYKNQVVFAADTQYGNGTCGYFQYLKDGDMIFNSIAGTYRLTFGEERGLNRSPRL